MSENEASPTDRTAPNNEGSTFSKPGGQASPLKIQRLERRLARDRKRLQTLEQDLAALTQQLNYTGNRADRNQLKRQIDAIEQELETALARCEATERELAAASGNNTPSPPTQIDPTAQVNPAIAQPTQGTTYIFQGPVGSVGNQGIQTNVAGQVAGGQILVAGDNYHRATPQAQPTRASSVPNPFTPLTGRVDDPDRFFDRQRERQRIFELLNSRSNIALIGKRAIGKSSLLHAIARAADPKLQLPRQPVYLNLQRVRNEADFYAYLCDEIGIPTPKSFGYEIVRTLKQRRLLLLIDEVEKMTGDGFTYHIRDQLRSLAEGRNAPLRLILAARTPLNRLFDDTDPTRTSPLANVCMEVRLEPWPETIARDFIAARLAPTSVRFSETEIHQIVQASQGNPQQLMQSCHQAYADRREATP